MGIWNGKTILSKPMRETQQASIKLRYKSNKSEIRKSKNYKGHSTSFPNTRSLALPDQLKLNRFARVWSSEFLHSANPVHRKLTYTGLYMHPCAHKVCCTQVFWIHLFAPRTKKYYCDYKMAHGGTAGPQHCGHWRSHLAELHSLQLEPTGIRQEL